ncbi:hypothetical protein ACG3SL_12900 [Sphingomonas sp. CJ20]
MRDRRVDRALADIAALRDAQRTAAHQELAEARAREDEAVEASRRADLRTESAARAWDRHLGSAAFAPELARALANALVDHGRASAFAQMHRDQCFAASAVAERAWHDGDARCRLAGRALDDSRRALRRARDSRALDALADRIASNWRRA